MTSLKGRPKCKLTKKSKVVVAGVALVGLAGTGTALAYFTTTGNGTGSAGTSAGAASLVLAQTSRISNMYPGDAPQTISGTVRNTAGNSAYVKQVSVSIASVTPAAGVTGGCSSADYSLTLPDMVVNQDIAAGATVTFTGAKVQFQNLATNQDGCKGATVNLAYAAS